MFNPLWFECATLLSLTHWNRDEMASVLQTTFPMLFSWIKIALITISLKYEPRGPIVINPAFVQIIKSWWLSTALGTSHYRNQSPLIYWHIYASLDHNAWVTAGAKPFPGPMLIYPPEMSMNWIQTYAFLSNMIISGSRFVATEFILSK